MNFRQHCSLLLSALQEICLLVGQIDLDGGTVHILQHAERHEDVGKDFDYEDYLARRIATIALEAGLFLDKIRLEELRRHNDHSRALDLSIRGHSIFVSFPDEGSRMAFLVILKTEACPLLRRVLANLSLLNNCDCFFYLDADKNSHFMFSNLHDPGLPPVYCPDYTGKIAEYVDKYIVPEDRETALREMAIPRILEELDRTGTHAVHFGVLDPQHGYTRKRIEFCYCDRESRLVLFSQTDITRIFCEEERRRQELLDARTLASVDPLTGILNRQAFRTRVMERLEKEGTASTLLFMDLDNFKLINDTCGHQGGDRVLRSVAAILSRAVRSSDLVARYGGDEFLIHLHGVESVQVALAVAERIRASICSLVCEGHEDVPVSCSMGLAMFPDEASTYDDLVRVADHRLYDAKNGGKNRVSIRRAGEGD